MHMKPALQQRRDMRKTESARCGTEKGAYHRLIDAKKEERVLQFLFSGYTHRIQCKILPPSHSIVMLLV